VGHGQPAKQPGQAGEGARQQREHETGAAHHRHGDGRIAQDAERQQEEEHAEQGHQPDGGERPARPARLGDIAQRRERPDRARAGDRQQAEDQRGGDADGHARGDGSRVDDRREGEEERARDQGGDEDAEPDAHRRADGAAEKAEQRRFQSEHGHEVAPAVAHGLEHGDFQPAAAQQHLHRVDDADAADEQREQPDDAQEGADALDLRPHLLLLLRDGGRRDPPALLPDLSGHGRGRRTAMAGDVRPHPGIADGTGEEIGERGVAPHVHQQLRPAGHGAGDGDDRADGDVSALAAICGEGERVADARPQAARQRVRNRHAIAPHQGGEGAVVGRDQA